MHRTMIKIKKELENVYFVVLCCITKYYTLLSLWFSWM